jgi:virulence factor Mce-like protein
MADRVQGKHRRGRMVRSCNMTWLGFGAVTLVAVLIGALIVVKEMGVGYRRYTAEFVQAASLQKDNVVTVAGVPVGNVTGVRLVGDRVEVSIRVRNNIPVGRDTRAAIKITTLFGSRYLDLRPAGDGAPPHQAIDLAHTEVPYDLQAALADSTRTFEQVDAERIAASLTVLNNQLSELPAVVPQAMENVHALSSVIAQRRSQLGALLTSTANVTNMLRRQQSGMGILVHHGQDLAGEFVARSAAFHLMVRALTEIVNSMRAILVSDRGHLDDAMHTLEELSGKLAKQDALFRNVLQVAPVAVREIANATGYGNGLEMVATGGPVVDSWMCAISGRAKQFGMIQYFKDCQ